VTESPPPTEVEVLDPGAAVPQLKEVEDLITSMAAPWAEVDKVREMELTKRHAISAGITRAVVYAALAIVLVILGLAFVALLLSKTELAEKIVIALLGFLGGLGVGRSLRSPVAPKTDD
jgi:hypothetical protein